MQILPDGNVKIKNFETGEERVVSPGELPTYGGNDLLDQYIKLKKLNEGDSVTGFQISAGTQSSGNTNTNTNPAGISTTATPNGYSKESYNADLIRDIQTTGGKHATELKQLYDLNNPTSAADPDARKRQVILQQAAPVLSRIVGSAMEAPTGWTGWFKAATGNIPGVEGGQAEYLARDTEGFARLIASAFASEVGVATNKDVNRWLKIMPRPGDTMPERIRQSEKLIEQIKSEASSLGIEVPPSVIDAAKLLPQKQNEKTLGDINKVNLSQNTLPTIPPNPPSQPPTNKGAFTGPLEKSGLYDIPVLGGLVGRAGLEPIAKGAEIIAEGLASPVIDLATKGKITNDRRFMDSETYQKIQQAKTAQEAGNIVGPKGLEAGLGTIGLLNLPGMAKNLLNAPKNIKEWATPMKTSIAKREATTLAYEKAGNVMGTNEDVINTAKLIVKNKLTNLDPEYGPLIQQLAKGKGISPTDALKLSVRAGQQTFTTSGHPRLTQMGGYYSLLDKALNKEFAQKIPDVIKYSSQYAKALPKSAKQLEPLARVKNKALSSLVQGIPAAIALGLGGYFVNKTLGEGE